MVHIHQYEDEGDILVFLTGKEEIERACEELRLRCRRIDHERRVIAETNNESRMNEANMSTQ